jgi:hypothetical protein
MKNLILENDNEFDGIPDKLSSILETQFLENREFWFSFRTAFYPKEREETMKRFASLESGDNIICQTVFDGWMQLELVVELLIKLKEMGKKINFYIVIPDLKENIQDYFDEYESELTPNTEEYNDSPSLRKEFKKQMDQKMVEVLDYHSIYNLYRRESKQMLSKDFNIK